MSFIGLFSKSIGLFYRSIFHISEGDDMLGGGKTFVGLFCKSVSIFIGLFYRSHVHLFYESLLHASLNIHRKIMC